jgi:hypothetical protein
MLRKGATFATLVTCALTASLSLFATGSAGEAGAQITTLTTALPSVGTPQVPPPLPTSTTTTSAPPATSTTTTAKAHTTTTVHSSVTHVSGSSVTGSGGSGGPFTLPAGAALPSDQTCASQVKKTAEQKPGNNTANHTKPSSKPNLQGNFGSDPVANQDLARVDGNFTGTTDEILQWAACKWGWDVDMIRADAVVESNWNQNAQGAVQTDSSKCVDGMKAPCALAFGIIQVRADFHPNTYPYTAQSTAFDVDYALALQRACFDGHLYLGAKTKGDAWGCVGAYYSGQWLDSGAQSYIAKVQAQYNAKPWTKW